MARLEHDRLQVAAPGEEHVGAGEPAQGDPQVAEQEEERGHEHRGADQALGGQRLQEHALVARLAEPEPLPCRARRARGAPRRAGNAINA